MKDILTRSFLLITIFVAIISSNVFAAIIVDDAGGCAHTYKASTPTCTEAKKCTKCGTVAAKALGHTYNISSPTCTEAKICTRCGTVAVKALGHTYNISSPTCTEAKKCTKCGYVARIALKHSYEYNYSGTSHWKECSRCNNKLTIEKHLYESSTNTCTKDRTCMICGYEAKASGHNYNISSPTCTESVKCIDCGYVKENATGHVYYNSDNYDGDVYVRTHTDFSYHWKVCSKCGGVAYKETHTLGQNGTCVVCGYICEHKNESGSPTETLSYADKNETEHIEKKTCTRCKIYLREEEVGHTYVDGVCACGRKASVECKEHKFEDGICKKCLFQCPHEEWDNEMCTRCRYYCQHDGKKKYLYDESQATAINHYIYTKCLICGDFNKIKTTPKRHNFKDDGFCIECGYECEHSKTYETADYLNKKLHKLKTVCEICDKEISNKNKSHNFNVDGKCEECLFQCPHGDWTGPECGYCGAQCKHNGRKEYLYYKDLETSTDHYRCTKCSICESYDVTKGTYEPHDFDKDGKCICGYECKHSKTYEKVDSVNKNYHALKTICEKCGKEISNEKTSHIFNENGKCTKCAYECNHKYGNNVTYMSNGDKHIETKKCTNCNATISEEEQEHNFSNRKCILCKQKEICLHTSTKTEFVVVKDMIHTEKTICNLCGDIIKTNQVKAITDFDATYLPTSDTTHKFSLKCKNCDFTYDGSGDCSFDMVTHKCAYCTNKLTKCNDKTHNHKLICNEGVTTPHTLYYSCDKYSLRWSATEKNQKVLADFIVGLEFECEACGEKIKSVKHKDCKQHQLSTITKYENENIHIIKSVCEVCYREISKTEENHQFKSTIKYKNEIAHTVTQECTVCGYKKTDEREHKNLKQVRLMQATEEKHKLLMNCSECGNFRIEEEHIKNAQGKCTLCGFVLINSDEVIKAKKLNISLSNKKLKVGETIDLQDSLSVSPENAKINLEWNASNANVTLKANGKLTATKEGNTKITVTDTISGKTASVNIKIESDKSVSSTETKNTTFKDVESDSWYNEVVQKATKESIFNGVTENEFAPNDYITRGMFVTALARVDKIDVAGYANLFSDVDDEIYYADSIKWASVYGIVNGVGDGKFAPDELMTREEMAVMIHNYIDSQYKNAQLFEESEDVNASKFNDSDEISSWANVAVNELAEMGIINGNENGNFAPKDNVTRAEAAAVLVRLSEKTKVNN